ncbi:Vascular endothelial growth factor receptor 1, partial [Orchesella cincta]
FQEKNILGKGEFAIVVRGKIISESRLAAIKISKPTVDVNFFKIFLSEIKIMLYIGKHKNVVSLIGVCTQDIKHRKLLHLFCFVKSTILQICDLGSLERVLRSSRTNFVNLINANQELDSALAPQNDAHLSTIDLISFSAQIANGMAFLVEKSIVHADLAARNVLLTSNKVAKISDFGFLNNLLQAPLPWRWMAIESLTTLAFSEQSDVWSYGVTLFEIFSLGDMPFPNESWNKQFLIRLQSGMRMGRPLFSTQEIYSKITTCWEKDPALRPTFHNLKSYFGNALILLERELISNDIGSNFENSILRDIAMPVQPDPNTGNTELLQLYSNQNTHQNLYVNTFSTN